MRQHMRNHGSRHLLRRRATGVVAGLVVATLAACSGAGPTDAAARSAQSARPALAAAVSGGAACVGAPNSAAAMTMDVAGKQRAFIEHLPAGFDAGRRYPAIIAFPGRGESDSLLESYAQLDGVDAIVLYAQGLNGEGGKPTWEATPYAGDSAHDYAFATDLVQWLAGSSCVDAGRVDLTGKSDGAGFAASAACGITGVAAVATISGAFYQEQNHCTADGRPIPILNMHGADDPVVPYDGDPSRGLYSTQAWLRLWQQRDRCAEQGTDQAIAPDVTRTTWSNCSDGTEVTNYRIADGGHTWPGATAPSGPGGTTHSIDAAQVITAFFAAHPLAPVHP
ncbi:alpha/beta hydrolase family esterase [Kitasatospora sp. NPDC052896]|uniref:alpha/beta hydrolase family esterase n=1 Tax=Kitasatospora sp. NPDC052896 TaxID=3364061 RepID=UPI0037C76870